MLFDAMFLNPVDPAFSLTPPLVGLVGMVVGVLWLRRMAGSDPDKEPSSWRYRRIEGLSERKPRKPLPTPGWIATRLAMVFATLVLGFVVAAPALFLDFGYALRYAPWVWLAAVGLAGVGTAWIFRIARRSPEAGPSYWRYRN
jgi:hypothetical protein